MKSEGVKDILEWLEIRCKSLKADLDEDKADRYSGGVYTARVEARFQEALSIKIGVEKYMKKLKHQGD